MADGGGAIVAPRDRLFYYPDTNPGITRRRAGRGFTYIAPDGTRIDRGAERDRLEAMAVPPAYVDVWMSPHPAGHLMATGYDRRQRKQYRYHPDWASMRSETKYARLAEFGRLLPRIRRRVQRDLSVDAGDRAFALAVAVTLLDRLALRIGNPAYTDANGSYGLVTLRRRHVRLTEGGFRLDFVAKGGKRVRRSVHDRTLNRILGKCRDLPGAEILCWVDGEGDVRRLTSGMVNEYLRQIAGCDAVTAKSFRTWVGSLAAFEVAVTEERPSARAMSRAAAERLANTAAIARSSYIHPAVLDRPDAARAVPPQPAPRGLTALERRLLHFLDTVA